MTRIIGYICDHAAYSAADLAGESGLRYSPDVLLIGMPCAGRLDVATVLKAFRGGADAVFVAGCLEGNCHHAYGNVEGRKRVAQAKAILDALGLDGRRLEIFNLASNQDFRFKEMVDLMQSRVEELGRSPLAVRE